MYSDWIVVHPFFVCAKRWRRTIFGGNYFSLLFMSSPAAATCLNCSQTLNANIQFCPECGQKTDTHQLGQNHTGPAVDADCDDFIDFYGC